jgi:hypothetical protein
MGYNTLDLVMFVIVAFILFIASRVPVKDAPAKKVGLRSDMQKNHPNSYSLK